VGRCGIAKNTAARKRWLKIYPIAVLCAVLLLALGLRVRNIAEAMPYCRHVDENTWISIAWRMMREKDPNPRRFTKPSLQAYTMVAGSYVGLARAKLGGQASRVEDLGKSAYPFYQVPAAVEVVKWLFAGLAVAALASLGVLARRVSGKRALLYLAPALALVSSSYFLLSWSYMNVDTLGTFFVLAVVAHVVGWHARSQRAPARNDWLDVCLAGALSGLAIGSKYNLFAVVVPCGLALLFRGRQRLLVRGLLFSAVLLLTFALTTPYAILDSKRFLAGALREMRHYATGHKGMEPHRGLSAFLAYGRVLWDNWGLLLVPAAAGLAKLGRDNWRVALLTFSYPLVFLLYMSLQRVVFERNIMALHLFVALAAALGAAASAGVVRAALRRKFRLPPRRAQLAAIALAVAVLAACTPWAQLRVAYRRDIESRNSAERWLRRNVNHKTPLLVDSRIQMDTRRLGSKWTVTKFDASRQALPRDVAAISKSEDYVAVLAEESLEQSPLRAPRAKVRFGGADPDWGGTARRSDPALVIVSGERARLSLRARRKNDTAGRK
jgi:hypothetical protein